LNGYDALQEAQITLGKLQGLSEEQLRLYCNPDLDYLQMEQIRLGFHLGLSFEYVAVYANPLLSAHKMFVLRYAALNKVPPEYIGIAGKPDYSFEQMLEVMAGLLAGLPVDKVARYASSKLTHRQMAALRLELETSRAAERTIAVDIEMKAQEAEKKNTERKAELITLDGYTDAQLAVINLAKQNGATEEQLKVLCNLAFAPDEMQAIRFGYENHLTVPQVMMYADPRYNASQMNVIRRGLELGLGLDEIQLFADPGFNTAQMKTLFMCLSDADRLTFEQVELLADPEIPAYRMEELRCELLNGKTADELKLPLKKA
jgi:hypothetical protein